MKPKTHGGHRKNAGRPKANTTQYVARLTINQVKWLQSIDDAGSHLQTALAHYMATRPLTKRRAKRPQAPRHATALPKDADTSVPTPSKRPSEAPRPPKDALGTISYPGQDGSTHYLLNTESIRAAKQAAYQKTLTKE